MAAMAPPPMSAGMPAATASIASAGSAVASDSGLGVKLLGLGALGLAGCVTAFFVSCIGGHRQGCMPYKGAGRCFCTVSTGQDGLAW